MRKLPSVLWHCWLGGRKGIRPVKKYGEDGGGGHWLVWMEWRPARWLVCLPLLISPCTIKSRSSLLAPADLGGPGKRAVKRLWWLLVCRVNSVCHFWNLRNVYCVLARENWSSGDCVSGGYRENYQVCSVQYCVQQLYTLQCTHMNRPNSSLDWVLSHWAHFTVLRFIFILCITVYCMHA